MQTTMEEQQREAAELTASIAAKRAGQAPQKRKRDDSSPPKKTTGILTRGGRDRFKEPKPRTELYRSRQRHPPQRGRGERKDRNRE